MSCGLDPRSPRSHQVLPRGQAECVCVYVNPGLSITLSYLWRCPSCPQAPAAATANPAPCFAKVCHRGPDLPVGAHMRRHREALSSGVLRGLSCAWLDCLCLMLAGKQDSQGTAKGGFDSQQQGGDWPPEAGHGAAAIWAGAPSGMVPESHPGTSFPAERIHPSLDCPSQGTSGCTGWGQ